MPEKRNRRNGYGLSKKNTGISGHSYHFLDGTKGFVDANGKGILVRNYEYDSERLFRWTEIEQRIGRMIREDRYLTAEERESLQPVSGYRASANVLGTSGRTA